MTDETLLNAEPVADASGEELLNFDVSDEALEAAASAETRSYTHQTSAYNRCCR